MCLQASERWDILDICNYIIPRINCVGKEAVLISGGLILFREKYSSYYICTKVCSLKVVYLRGRKESLIL